MNNSSAQEFDVFASAWLKGVPEQNIQELRRITEVVQFEDKTTIYALGGPQHWLWGVASGQVQVRVALIELEPVLGHIHHPGAWFGESELIHGIDGLVEMRATGPTKVAKVPYLRFRQLAYREPSLWEAFARLTSMNQLLAMSAANDLALRTSRKRIAATLLRLSGRRGVLQGSSPADTVHASQQEISELANISLSKASVHLGVMSDEGLIGLEYGRITLKDPCGLLQVIDT